MHSKAFSTLFIGRPTISLDTIDSTNTYAQELLSKSNPSEGTAIFTQNQTAGKGQYGRVWVSEDTKNIAVSIILKPIFLLPKESYYLNLIAALAVSELIENYIDKEIFIKWPNDIYVKQKKISGILIENTMSNARLQSSVLGIGINVNQTDFDPNIPNPTSFVMENSHVNNCVELVNELFTLVEKYYLKLKRREYDFLYAEYDKRLYLKNSLSPFVVKGIEQNGIIRGIDKQGMLKLETKTGLLTLGLNEIQYKLS